MATVITTSEDLDHQILELKKLAVAKKREGDIESAKQALLESKRLQLQLQQQQQQQQQEEEERKRTREEVQAPPPSSPDDAAKDDDTSAESNADDELLDQLDETTSNSHEDDTGTAAFSLAEMTDLEMMTEFATGGLPVPSLEDYQAKIEDCKRAALAFKQQDKTKEALQQMRYLKQLQAVQQALEGISGGASAAGAGQAGSTSLLHDDNDTEEDKALMRELMADEDNNEQADALTSIVDHCLELEDLIDMDHSEIRDAMDLGMILPPVEKMHQQVQEQKAQALRCKQSGDLEGAKVALAKFKTWSQKVSTIEQVIQEQAARSSTTTSSPYRVKDVDLEKLLLDEEKATSAPKEDNSNNKPANTAQHQRLKPKSSEELRQEAIRLRDEKKIPEATAVLKLYKQALSREAEQAELAQRQDTIRRLQDEVQKAQEQQDWFIFFQRLVDSTSGTQQLQAWWRYADLCSKVAELIQTNGTKAVTISNIKDDEKAPLAAGRLRLVPKEDLTQIIRNAIPTEERVELSILDVLELHTNKAFQTAYMPKDCHKAGTAGTASTSSFPEWLQLEVHVSIQLPLNETETDKPIDLHFRSQPFQRAQLLNGKTNKETQVKVDNDNGEEAGVQPYERQGRVDFWSLNGGPFAQHVTLARGDSKFAKAVIRRMERRKITIALVCHAHANISDHQKTGFKGWFGGGSSNNSKRQEETTPPVNLGKIILETKDLLDHGCIVGEFPLLGTGKRNVGGKLRLSIRTGVSFLDGNIFSPSISSENPLDDLPLYADALKFAVVRKPDADETTSKDQ